MERQSPLISVVMAVYNGEKHLQKAIDSVLNQTLRDFEFIIIDDGSQDASADIIKTYRDARIKYFRNQNNLGLTCSLNIGLTHVSAEYIARMDADDISLPSRFEKQASFLKEHPQIGIVGCAYQVIDEDDQPIMNSGLPLDDLSIRWALLFNNSFCHTSLMMRKSVLEQIGGQYDDYPSAEDYALISKMIRVSKAANLPDYLVNWRKSDQQISFRKKTEQEATAARISRNNINELMGSDFLTMAESETLPSFLSAAESIKDLNTALLHKWIKVFRVFENKNVDQNKRLPAIKRSLVRDICHNAAFNFRSLLVSPLLIECLKISPLTVIKYYANNFLK